MTILVSNRGNGTANSAPTNASFINFVPKSLTIDQGSSIFAFINPENSFHANQTAINPAENGNITDPIAL